jgi:acyl-CoA thioester hydrolase
MKIDFLRPARLDDELQVAVVIEQMRRASLLFAQTLHRAGQAEPLARASVRVGCVDVKSFRPCALPEAFTRYISSLSSGVSV